MKHQSVLPRPRGSPAPAATAGAAAAAAHKSDAPRHAPHLMGAWGNALELQFYLQYVSAAGAVTRRKLAWRGGAPFHDAARMGL